jgi:archaellum component FlaC
MRDDMSDFQAVNNFDIAVRLALVLSALDGEDYKVLKKLCGDALEEIERLRAEVKKLKYLATL